MARKNGEAKAKKLSQFTKAELLELSVKLEKVRTRVEQRVKRLTSRGEQLQARITKLEQQEAQHAAAAAQERQQKQQDQVVCDQIGANLQQAIAELERLAEDAEEEVQAQGDRASGEANTEPHAAETQATAAS